MRILLIAAFFKTNRNLFIDKLKAKLLVLALFLLGFTNKGYSDGAHITGATQVEPNATEYYEATFDYGLYPYTSVTWFVSGGYIVSQNINPTAGAISCTIVWDTPGYGSITVAEDLGGQWADLGVLIGTPPISPLFQFVNYGSSPSGICVSLGYSFQWQESIDGYNWTDIIGANGDCYFPSPIFQTKYYKCLVTIGTGSVYTDVVTAQIVPLDAGIIYVNNEQPNYNTSVTVTNTPAAGGFCYAANYQYTWEQSNDGSPWTVIGTGQNYPVTSITVIGKVQIRRKIICGGASLYSNTLTITPLYTPVDYENRNYVREITVVKRGIQSYYQADQLTVGDKFQSTTYLDGLGRPVQSVDKEISPAANNTWNDIVTHYEYDAAGRTPKGFLPYATNEFPGKFKTNAATVQAPFVTTFFNEPSTAPTYSLVEYDNSPLNRVLKTMAPGQSWAGNGVGITMNYDFNNSNSTNEKVHIWSLDYSSSALPVTDPTLTYANGKLLKNTTADEHGNKVITYTDFSGNIILKKVQEADPGVLLTPEHSGWTCTYYVYDDFGMVRYVITPKAVQYLDNNGWSLTQDIVNELCYKYQYDEKGRLIVKKKPGAGEESMVYDKKDRLVLSQDANQKLKNQWFFSLYDNLNRSIATGLFENSATRQEMQSYVNTLANGNQTNSVFVGNGIYQNITVDNPVAGSTGTNNYCNSCTTSTVTYNSVTHYDSYSYSNAKAFNANNTLSYSSSSDPQIEPTVKTDRTINFVTGEKIRILDADNNPLNDKFIFSTAYYDEQSRSLQNLTDNIKNGTDYQTNQYSFSENLVSSFVSHNNGTETFTVTTKQEFDKTGRLTKLYKNFNNSFYKQLAEYNYDAFGQIKNKRLAPGYTGTGGNEIESINYDYNIRGWLTGINKDYALSNDNYSQWNKYFGMYLGYANTDNLFAQPRLNGNITGSIWKSQGDNSPRKYDYTYDRMDRFTSALFQQKKRPTDSWLNTEVDFSAYVEYEDNHGNIKTMKHMGVIPGINNGIIVDMLYYTYNSISGTNNLKGNKLIKVDDIGHGLGTKNGILGDFKDGVTVNEEYFYDDNGNLVKDLNKNITDPNAQSPQNGVTYNFLNKPEKIVIPGKATIEFTYDASGEKLSKKVTPASGPAKTTYYISNFVYEENNLQFVLHEEGRLKIITPHVKVNNIDYDLNAGTSGVTWPGGKQGVFEYFLKDHLGSTRMVLTEEIQKEYYLATMESNIASTENQLFGAVNSDGSIPATNELERTRLLNNCGSTPWPGNCTNLAKLTASDATKKLGPNMILKVMAGDIVSTRSDYYYLNNNSTGSGSTALGDVLFSLIGAITSPGKANELSKNQFSEINSSLLNNSQLQQFITDQNTTGTNNEPKAYLNVIFLDEQFKYVDADLNTPDVGSGSLRVNQANNSSAYLFMQKKAPKNGWVFVYLSNQSNESVYFDNFYVTQDHSRIAEETHYYPYGLKIAGISSKAYNKLENKYGFAAQELNEEGDLNWNEFRFRDHDPQIGRFVQSDPLADFYVHNSPYAYAENDVIRAIDLEGLEKYIKTETWVNGKLRLEEINATFDPDLNDFVDYDFKKIDGSDLTDLDVMVITINKNADWKTISVEKTYRNELTSSEKKFLHDSKQTFYKNGSRDYWINIGKGNPDPTIKISPIDGKKGLTDYDNEKFIPLIKQLNIPLALSTIAVGVKPYYSTDHGNVPNGDLFLDMMKKYRKTPYNLDNDKFLDLPDLIKEDGGIKAIAIKVKMQYNNYQTNGTRDVFQRGLEYRAEQIKQYLSRSGIKKITVSAIVHDDYITDAAAKEEARTGINASTCRDCGIFIYLKR